MPPQPYPPRAAGAALVLVLGALGAPVGSVAAEPSATCAGLPATIVGTDVSDHLTGTDGDDVVWLGAGSDGFHGGAGDDVVCGGPGQDSLYGDAGADWLDGGEDPDYNVVGGPGDDVVHGGAGDDLRLHGDDFGSDTGADEVHGDDGDDTLHGEPGSGTDLVDGGPGSDVVSFYLSGGSVRIDVAAGTATGGSVDTLVGLESYLGSEYDDSLTGSPDDDVLNGGGGADVVQGLDGGDTLTAAGGTISGGRGPDTFQGTDEDTDGLAVDLGPGRDRAVLDAMRRTTVRGGPGDDVFAVPRPGFGVDSAGTYADLRGGAGHDVLTFAGNPRAVRIDVRAGTAAWSLGSITFARLEEFNGSERGDVLLGSTAADRLLGRAGADVVKGRRGPDLLRGGAGRDRAYGGHGRDTCSAEVRFSCERR